jgi:hypothetical protein
MTSSDTSTELRFVTQFTKLRIFPLYASLLLMMPGCSDKREGAAES